jgi:dimethylargininase
VSLLALVREISPALERCELSHLARQPIDLAEARRQHAGYVAALVEAGCRIELLPPEPELPDAVFVEDTAVVLDQLAVTTRPGAASRRPEVESVAPALARHREVRRITGPGTLDGGDVLRLGRTLFVGRTARSSAEGAGELAALTRSAGYGVRPVRVTGCLHLKSAVTEVADGLLLINPAWVDATGFPGYRTLSVDPAEPFAANALRIGSRLIYPAEFPRTASRLRAEGLDLREVEAGELAKAEGGVTCCSLLLQL